MKGNSFFNASKFKSKLLVILMSVIMVTTYMPALAFAEVEFPVEEGIRTAEEFAAALAQGGEIKLAADITYESAAAVTIVGETTIDLAGHTLNITTPNTARQSIYVGTSTTDCNEVLTIKDSSEGSTGVLNVTNQYTSNKSYIFYVYGTLDIQGGTINQTASKASSFGIDIYTSTSTFKMSGGTIKKGTSLNSNYSLYASSGKKIITGGVIEEHYAGNTVSGWEVSGGVFKTEPTYEMMKPGYITYKITDEGATKGWYGVKEGTYVGLVGTTVYTDVASFANAIGGNKITVEGTKLTLTDDVNLGSASANKVTFLSDITLDLAGYSITGAVAGSSAYMFYVNQKEATVTITDSSEGKTGKVENSTSSDCNTVGVNRGKLIIDHAKLIGETTANKSVKVITTITSDANLVLQNKAEIDVYCPDVVYTQYGIHMKYGACEIDDSTINVNSGSSATGIYPSNTACTVKIGSKNTGTTHINVTSSGINTSASSLAGIGYSSTGCSGNIYIANTEVNLKTEIGKEDSKAQSCYGLGFSKSSTWEIGSNVSVLITGKSNAKPSSYGIYALGGGTISGSNISFDVDTESEGKRVGIYLSDDKDITINPGTNVSFQINRSGYETGNNLMVENKSTKGAKVLISGGLYKGGELSGITATGGTFDTDPSEICATGYVAKANTPSEGLWTVVPNVANLVKNTRLDKSYTNIADAVAEAEVGDELQLMDNISSSSDLEINSINLDLNGHNLGLNKLITSGNVTITDKQATSFENAGTLTASVNVGAGCTVITKCRHSLSTSNAALNPYHASGTALSPAQLVIRGVKGEYSYIGSSVNRMVYSYDNSRVIIDNEDGFETSLKFTSSGQSSTLVYGSENNAEVTINGGTFEISCSSSTSGAASVFGPDTKGVVNGGKFKLTSNHSPFAKIASNTNSTIDIQGGYFVGIGTQGEVTKDSFFTNASYLGDNGKNSVVLEENDPMYVEGYRYTVDSVAVAKIGDTPYSSVQLAINAANVGDTITLLQNTVGRDLVLNKELSFKGDYKVTLTGNKPLTLGNEIDKPDCFDVSATSVYLEKNNGEKIYYKDWLVNGGIDSESTGAWVDYNADDYKQIVLTNNLQKSIIINKTCTIDLNGFVITGQSGSDALSIRGDVICTVKDTGDNQTGKIISDASGAGGYTVELNNLGCTFVLESGAIENTSDTGAGICIIGDDYHSPTNATVTINGGKIATHKGYAVVDNGQSSKNVNININGGEITSENGVAIYHPASGTMTLNGGTISGNTGIYIRSGSLVVPKESTVKVRATGTKGTHNPSYSGGAEMTGDAVVICETAYPGGTVSADIVGGAFYSENAFAVASYANTGLTAIKDFLKGGIYGADSAAIDISNKNLIADGYKDIPNPDTNTNEDHPWMIGVPPVAPTVDKDAKEESATQADVPGSVEQGLPEKVVDEVIDEISKNTSVSDDKATNIQTKDVESKIKTEIEKTSGVKLVDSTSQLKITVKSVATKTTETKISAISAQTVTTTSAKYDVKPWVTIETTNAQGEKTTVTREITNAELAAADVSIAFRLAVPASMKGNEVLVKHYPEEATAPDWSKTYAVQGTGDNRYVALEANTFSVYEIADYSTTEYVALNLETNTPYTVLADALSEAGGQATSAENARTIVLLKDLTSEKKVTLVEVAPNVTLDLNGHNLEAKTTMAWGLVKNSASTGKLIVAEDHFAYFGGKEKAPSSENVLPVWDTTGEKNGYVFYAVNNFKVEWKIGLNSTEGNPKYRFKPKDTNNLNTILSEAGEVKVNVVFEYRRTGKDYYDTLTVEFSREYIDLFLTNPDSTIMYASLLGTDNIDEIKATTYLTAGTTGFSTVSDTVTTSRTN